MKPSRFSYLVTGAGRGGTSLLAALIGSHPMTEAGFERHMEHLLGRHAESAGSVAARLNAFRAACDAEAAAQPKIWGNKITTEQIANLTLGEPFHDRRSIPDFFSFFGDVKHIFILRDGRSCAMSKTSRTGIELEAACRRWMFSVDVLRHFREGCVDGRWVTFEQLLAKPHDTLAGLCDYLEIPFTIDMLRGTDHPGLLPEYRRPAIEPARAEIPTLPDDLVRLMEPQLRYAGYLA